MRPQNHSCGFVTGIAALLFVGCAQIDEPKFDNGHDPYGATYLPPAPHVTVYELDTTTVRGGIYRADDYSATLIVERRDGNNPTYKRIATLPGTQWEFFDRDTFVVGRTYYYRGMAFARNGNPSPYSGYSSVQIVRPPAAPRGR